MSTARSQRRHSSFRAALLMQAAAFVLISCETVEVDPTDRSAPVIQLRLLDALASDARDAGSQRRVSNPILPESSIVLTPRDSSGVGFFFVGIDPGSGIRATSARVVLSFRCGYSFGLDGPVQYVPVSGLPIPATVFGPVAADAARLQKEGLTYLALSLNRLWEEGRCQERVPQEAIGFTRRSVLMIAGQDGGTWFVSATNGAGITSRRSGSFFIDTRNMAQNLPPPR